MNTANDKIFDSAFRTMLERMPQLMIPLINEAFRTNYTEADLKLQLKNEHVDIVQELNRSTDSLLYVGDKRYHLECQKNPDSSMAIRMFEYDVAVALEASREQKTNEIVFPESCVLYLTHSKAMEDEVSIPVRFSDGYVHQYKVPVVKAQTFSIEEIFSKNLQVLLPYYILRYENALKSLGESEKLRTRLVSEYSWIVKRLHETVDVQTYEDLKLVMKKVLDYELKLDSRLKGEVDMIMDAEVWELPSDRRLREREQDRLESVHLLVEKGVISSWEEACRALDVSEKAYLEYQKNLAKEPNQEECADEMVPKKQKMCL